MFSKFNSIHPAFLYALKKEIIDIHQLASFNYSEEDNAKYLKLLILIGYDENQTEFTSLEIIKKLRKIIDEIQIRELKGLLFKIDKHLNSAKNFFNRYNMRFRGNRKLLINKNPHHKLRGNRPIGVCKKCGFEINKLNKTIIYLEGLNTKNKKVLNLLNRLKQSKKCNHELFKRGDK